MKASGDFPSNLKSSDNIPAQSLQNVPESSRFNQQITRRGFVTTVGALTGGVCFGSAFQGTGTIAIASDQRISGGAIPLKLKVNGELHALSIHPRVTLLDLLRENLALTGTKKGCDHGQCGACTVLAMAAASIAVFRLRWFTTATRSLRWKDSPKGMSFTPSRSVSEYSTGNH